MPGRPRKPTAVHDITGAFKKNPQRKKERSGEPVPVDGIDKVPPPHFNQFQSAVYLEILEQIPPRVATVSDKIIVEITAVLLAEFRFMGKLKSADLSLLIKNLSQLGMTPADRSKINLPGAPKKENPFKKVGYR